MFHSTYKFSKILTNLILAYLVYRSRFINIKLLTCILREMELTLHHYNKFYIISWFHQLINSWNVLQTFLAHHIRLYIARYDGV